MKKITKADKVYAAAFDVIEAVGYADDMGRGGFNLAALKDRAASLVKQDAEERKRGGGFLPSCFLEVLDLVIKCSAPHNRAIPESLMNHAARIANAASDPKPEALAQAYGERVAEGKARAEQDNKETARQISKTPAMKAATAREQESERVRREVKTPEAWDAEAVQVIEDAGTTQVAEHNRYEVESIRSRAAFLYSYATTINGIKSSLRDMLNSILHEVKMGQVPSALFLEACRAVILEEARRADKREIARLSALLAEQTERANTLASDAKKSASALAAESRQHEETRQKLQEATVRASELREAASTFMHGATRRDEEIEQLQDAVKIAGRLMLGDGRNVDPTTGKGRSEAAERVLTLADRLGAFKR